MTSTRRIAFAAVPFFSIPPLSDSLPPPDVSPAHESAVVEYPVRVNWRALALASLGEGGAEVSIALPGHAPVSVRQFAFAPRDGFVIDAEGRATLPGKTPDEAIGFDWFGVGERTEVTLTVERGVVVARVAPDRHLWTVVDSSAHEMLRRIDTRRYPQASEGDVEPDAPTPVQGARLEKPRAKMVDTIDVLFVYTRKALLRAGSQANLDAHIQASLDAVNRALANSRVTSLSVRNAIESSSAKGLLIDFQTPTDFTNTELNGLAPLDITSSASVSAHYAQHKRWLRQQPEVRAWRDQHAADVVMLVTGDGGDVTGDGRIDVCGNAYVQRPTCSGPAADELGCSMGAGFADFAYGAFSLACAVERYEFAHELSHTLGMEHQLGALASPVGSGSYRWSYAYRRSAFFDSQGIGHRTVTAYDCRNPLDDTDSTDYCPVKLHFSNPYVEFVDAPGFRTGLPAPAANDGYWTFNARTASLVAMDVADFRGPSATRIFRGDFEALPDLTP